jgi:hypothetical protein
MWGVAFTGALSHDMDIASDALVIVEMLKKYSYIELHHTWVVELWFCALSKQWVDLVFLIQLVIF